MRAATVSSSARGVALRQTGRGGAHRVIGMRGFHHDAARGGGSSHNGLAVGCGGAEYSGSRAGCGTDTGSSRRSWAVSPPWSRAAPPDISRASASSHMRMPRREGAPACGSGSAGSVHVSGAAAVAPRLLSLAQQRQAASEALCAVPTMTCPSHPLRPDAAQEPAPSGAFQDAAATAQRWLASCDPFLVTSFGSATHPPPTPESVASASTGVASRGSRPCGASPVTAQQRTFASTTTSTSSASVGTTPSATTARPVSNVSKASADDTTAHAHASTTTSAEEILSSSSAATSETQTQEHSADAGKTSTGTTRSTEQEEEEPEDSSVRPSPTFRTMCEACRILGLIHPGGDTRGNWDRAELKQAYRALARTYHPDVAGGDVRSMEQINEAYELLNSLTQQERASFEAWVHEGGEAALAAEDALMDGTGMLSVTAVVGEYLAVSGATTLASVLLFTYYYLYHILPAANQRKLMKERAAAEAAAAAAAAAAPLTLGKRVDVFLAQPFVVAILEWLQAYGLTLAIALTACVNGALIRNVVLRRLARP